MNLAKDLRERRETLKGLEDYLDKALEAALVAQLCSTGNSLSDAVSIVRRDDEEELKPLFYSRGLYLHYGWLATNLKAAREGLNKINLEQYEILRKRLKPTNRVYEDHLHQVQKHIRGEGGVEVKTVRNCLNKIFNEEQVTDALRLIGQINDHVDLVERTVDELISPPKKFSIRRWVAVAVFVFTTLAFFLLYMAGFMSLEPFSPDAAPPAPSESPDVEEGSESGSLTGLIMKLLGFLPLAGYVLMALSAIVAALGVFFPESSKLRKLGAKLRQAGSELAAFKLQS